MDARLGAVLALALLLLGVADARTQKNAGFTPTSAPASSVAVINSMSFHQEILAGVLTILRPMASMTHVYTPASTLPGRPGNYGFNQLLGPEYHGQYRVLPRLANVSIVVDHYDFLIFISPEYAPVFVRRFILASKPAHVVLIVHNADNARIPELPRVHPSTTLLALSPHVAASIKARLGNKGVVGWITPTARLRPYNQCRDVISKNGSICIAGFAMQGSLDGGRRNYSGLWSDISEGVRRSEAMRLDPRFRVRVLGSGLPQHLPALEEDLKDKISIHCNLQFIEFYEVIHHTYALLPSFANDKYLNTKFSSTVASSLVTGVPMVATEALLQSYTFIDRNAVFLQQEGESITDVMVRILALPEDTIRSTRKAVRSLRLKLNARAQMVLFSLMDKGGKEARSWNWKTARRTSTRKTNSRGA